jgi:hypothetical protein
MSEWAPNYLQEGIDIPKVIDKIKNSPFFEDTVDIAFCRAWESVINNHHGNLFNTIKKTYQPDLIYKFIDKLQDCDVPLVSSVDNKHLYMEKDYWDNLFRNAKQLIPESERILNSYYRWWIEGIGKEKPDHNGRFKKPGVMDPIENTAQEDWQRFYALFPIVFFSFLVLSKYKENSDLIRIIALNRPYDVPDFLGNDLWIQRMAFNKCIKLYGIQFIFDNYDQIRLELIYYALLKRSIPITDNKLKEHLLSHEHYANEIDVDTIVQLIS